MCDVTVIGDGWYNSAIDRFPSPPSVPLHSFLTHTPYKNVLDPPRPLVPLRIRPRNRLRTFFATIFLS